MEINQNQTEIPATVNASITSQVRGGSIAIIVKGTFPNEGSEWFCQYDMVGSGMSPEEAAKECGADTSYMPGNGGAGGGAMWTSVLESGGSKPSEASGCNDLGSLGSNGGGDPAGQVSDPTGGTDGTGGTGGTTPTPAGGTTPTSASGDGSNTNGGTTFANEGNWSQVPETHENDNEEPTVLDKVLDIVTHPFGRSKYDVNTGNMLVGVRGMTGPDNGSQINCSEMF